MAGSTGEANRRVGDINRFIFDLNAREGWPSNLNCRPSVIVRSAQASLRWNPIRWDLNDVGHGVSAIRLRFSMLWYRFGTAFL